MLAQWKNVYAVLVPVGLVCFALASIPNGSSMSWLATVGWFGFMLTLLTIVVFSVTLVARAILHRTRSAAKA
jgi:hypothetical protein